MYCKAGLVQGAWRTAVMSSREEQAKLNRTEQKDTEILPRSLFPSLILPLSLLAEIIAGNSSTGSA
jgi:hypothetical protein